MVERLVSSDGSDDCVVSSTEYFDADEMDYDPDENEIMFSRNDGTHRALTACLFNVAPASAESTQGGEGSHVNY
jgi:hypothetical protein